MADSAFLARAIVEAEKSGTERLGVAALFDLSESEMIPLIVRMLEEEIDGCDYSVSSFLVAERDGKAVAAIAGWVETLDDDIPAHVLRSNLFGHVLAPEKLASFRSKRDIIAPLQIEREQLTLQIEHVFVEPEHRGHALAGALMRAHVERALRMAPATAKAQVQLVANNTAALRAYEKDGFRPVRTYRSDDPRVLQLLPFNVRVLLEKDLNPIAP